MAIFGKRGDLLDYTYLQKRGLIKKSEIKHEKITRTKDGFVDLGSMNIEKSEEKKETSPLSIFDTSSTPTNSDSSANSGGFVSLFDSPAFGNSSNSSQSTTSTESSLSSSDLSAFKIKLEDLEYKLSNLIDKISLVESKLESFEKKVFN